MNTIAIDCGASFIKGALFEDDRILRRLQLEAPKVHPDADISSTSQIESLLCLVKEMLEDLSRDLDEAFLCISNEMHGFLLAYEDGAAFTDYISWQKEFGVAACDREGRTSLEILSSHRIQDAIRYTGMPLRAGLPSCNLLYLSRKGFLERAYAPLYFYTLGDYLLRMLSGAQPYCHPTNAAATGLFDLRMGGWNAELIETVGGKDVVFPEIRATQICFELLGTTFHALPALGDQQAALLGAGLKDTHTISFNLGTGAQVSVLTDVPAWDFPCQIRPYFNGMYLRTLPHIPSGRALNVFLRFFQDVFVEAGVEMAASRVWEMLLKASEETDETVLECDLSFFENPLTDHTHGSISNIQEYSLTVGQLMKAVFRQMADNFISAAKRVAPEKESYSHIIFSGGIARKIPEIRKNIENNYSNEIKVTIASDETLFGLMQYARTGEMKDNE